MFTPLTHVPGSAEVVVPSLPFPAALPCSPFFSQSLPHPDSQSRMCLAVLKLPLGNLIPDMKPETPDIPDHASRGANLQIWANMHGQLGVFWMLGGHLAFILPAPPSVSWISCGSLIGDLLHGNQSLPNVWTGERVPLIFYSFLQYKHPHISSIPPSPGGLYFTALILTAAHILLPWLNSSVYILTYWWGCRDLFHYTLVFSQSECLQ